MSKITIMGNPLVEYHIISGESAPEKFAAAELQKYFEKITGEAFQNSGSKEIRVYVDNTIGTGEEGYALKNKDNTLAIIGGGPRGVIYGVYEFLVKHLGVRFYTPDTEVLGNGGDIPELDESYSPAFEFRLSDWGGRTEDWCLKNHINAHALPDEKGGHYIRVGGGHSFERIMPNAEGYGQPCLCDPKNLELAIAYVREKLKENPNAKLVDVSQNDNVRYCQCEKCMAIIEEEGSAMGPIMRFVNAIADNIKDDYPNAAIQTFAYTYSRKPCKTAPLPNVIIQLCSIECCFSHPLDDETCERNRDFIRDIEGWGKICKRISIWDYVVNFSNYVAPFPNFHLLRSNMHFYARNGASGMYPESAFNAGKKSGAFFELRSYLLARLMWNPYMSETEYYSEMNGFLEAYYGAGWKYIRFFIDWMCSQAKDMHNSIYVDPDGVISRDRWAAAEEYLENLWEKAASLAEGDQVYHLFLSRLQWRYMRLMIHPDPILGKEFYDDIVKHEIFWRELIKLPNDCYDFADPPSDWYEDDPPSKKPHNVIRREAKLARRAEREKAKNNA